MSMKFLIGMLWLGLIMALTVAGLAANAKLGCPTRCGKLVVRYPFGIGLKCSLTPSYSLECDKSYNPPRAFTENLNSTSTRFRVFNITETQIIVNGMIAYNCPPLNRTINNNITSTKSVIFLPQSNSPFTLSNLGNTFSTAGSCDYYANVSAVGNSYENFTCPLSCVGKTANNNFIPGACALGNGCCDRPTSKSLKDGFLMTVKYLNEVKSRLHTTCGYVVFGKLYSFGIRRVSDFSDLGFVKRTRNNVPMVVDWVIGNKTCDEARNNPIGYVCQANTRCVEGVTRGYNCACNHGYQGNPYLTPGCSDINECASGSSNSCHAKAVCHNREGGYSCTCSKGYHGDGHTDGKGCTQNSPLKLILGLSLGSLLVLFIGSGINILIQKRRVAKARRNFFKQNGGLMLKEKLESSNRGSTYNYNSFKLFRIEELKRATKNFSKDLIAGKGGFGTVYKGTLRDGSLVAIKVSNLVDSNQIQPFISEMIILTQTHHRNIVQLLGCCLETEIPILVYEYITNGSLVEHVHDGSHWLTWSNRLRIATEIATALGYLHSAASTPIIHRDIKSANILLDKNYIAKISDFGASRLRPLGTTQMSTLVQGTLGYMDPEYLLTSQFTDKSDVYGFGVVVVELLTRQKPLSTERKMMDRNLAKYFITSFTEGRLLDIIDRQIVDEAPEEQLTSIAEIAQECLNIKGVNRPLMKDVAIKLARLQGSSETMTTPDDSSLEEDVYSRNSRFLT